MKKLTKKQTGGPAKTATKADTTKKKVVVDVARNPQYKPSGVLDSAGKMVYQRKKGSGPSKAPEGTSAASNFKKGGTSKSKKK